MLRRVLVLTPRDSDAMYNLGGVLKAQGRVEESIAVYQQAVAINADDWELCYNLGVALGDQVPAASLPTATYPPAHPFALAVA